MSCCGVGSEAMSQVLDCLIMVRMGKPERGGRIQKWLISQELSVQFTSELGQCIGESVPYHKVASLSC